MSGVSGFMNENRRGVVICERLCWVEGFFSHSLAFFFRSASGVLEFLEAGKLGEFRLLLDFLSIHQGREETMDDTPFLRVSIH